MLQRNFVAYCTQLNLILPKLSGCHDGQPLLPLIQFRSTFHVDSANHEVVVSSVNLFEWFVQCQFTLMIRGIQGQSAEDVPQGFKDPLLQLLLPSLSLPRSSHLLC